MQRTRQTADEALIDWGQRLVERTNDKFVPLYFDEHRYLVLMGGGGSGKSIFAGQKIIERAICESGHRFLVCRKVARTLRQSCFRQLVGQIAEYYPRKKVSVNRTDLSISFPNGSEIIFSGLDDVEKLKSIYGITGIWIEEASELEESDFNQLDIRLRDKTRYYKQIILSFNPISVSHWLKKRFFDSYDERATVSRTTYRDNRFLSAEAIKTLENFRETDEYFYTVYCLGQWGVTGKTVFDGKRLTERLSQLSPPEAVGDFAYETCPDGIRIREERWVDDPGGAVKIYKRPAAGGSYVIGADTAGDGSDYFVAQVLDAKTGEQAAVLRQRYDEDTFAKQLYCLGRYYRDALLCVEANFSTYPIKILGIMGYSRQFVREVEDTYDGTVRHAYGFKTDSLTRPLIIAELVRVMREHPETVNDAVTIEEMLTFVRNEKLRPEAEPGAHDDCVMALAIAHYCRPQQASADGTASGGTADFSSWPADLIADYQKASPEMRKMIEEQMR